MFWFCMVLFMEFYNSNFWYHTCFLCADGHLDIFWLFSVNTLGFHHPLTNYENNMCRILWDAHVLFQIQFELLKNSVLEPNFAKASFWSALFLKHVVTKIAGVRNSVLGESSLLVLCKLIPSYTTSIYGYICNPHY